MGVSQPEDWPPLPRALLARPPPARERGAGPSRGHSARGVVCGRGLWRARAGHRGSRSVGGGVQWSLGEAAGSAIEEWAAERGMDERGVHGGGPGCNWIPG